MKHEYAVFYHMWSEIMEPNVYKNLRTPVILSIATLRSVNSDIPIYVMDNSKDTENYDPIFNCSWGDFPEKLNFQVINESFHYKPQMDQVAGWKHLSRIIDVNQLNKKYQYTENVIYCDTDVFWLKNPIPLDVPFKPHRFCWDGYNTGFYYYNFNEINQSNQFIEVFEAYTKSAIYSKEVRELMKKHVNYDDWYEVWDEMIVSYMFHEHPELFYQTESEEHGLINRLFWTDLEKVKMIHCNGLLVNNEVTKQNHCRGLVCMVIEKIWNSINKVLELKDIQRMFSDEEIEFYKDKKFTVEQLSKLESIESGHKQLEHLWIESISASV